MITGTELWRIMRPRLYRCPHPDCRHVEKVNTNHFGAIYDWCPKCRWRRPGQLYRRECIEPIPGLEP